MANPTITTAGSRPEQINQSPDTQNNDKVNSKSDNAYAQKAVKLAKGILAAGLCIAAVASVGAVFGWTFTLCGINSGIATTSGAKVVTSVVATIGITMNSLAAKVVSAAANLAIFACAADIISGTNWLIRPPVVTNIEDGENRGLRKESGSENDTNDDEVGAKLGDDLIVRDALGGNPSARDALGGNLSDSDDLGDDLSVKGTNTELYTSDANEDSQLSTGSHAVTDKESKD
ncbi:hypothetical protein N9N03_01705 [Chlamydiia bacterium]|nr:hypothetical protein [Chlamydiia bacterium]